ncbi:hypothetical protein C1H76_6210 [Elsinoe australis]|uniref:CmcJ-like methyltransferase n=1 Tax=Elsinoe australis TaxID=40998 RepID=A0A4U7B0Y5_9PEZI|nr:hypothetical protein C1H76_6210 [Elsinoe australis]
MPLQALTTSVFCLERLEVYATHKPFEVRVERPNEAGDLGPQTNLRTEERGGIAVEDVRHRKHSLSFEKNGFFVLDIDVNMAPEEFEDKQAIEEKYLPVVAETLSRRLGAERIQIHDYLVRKSNETFPFSTGQPSRYEPPAMVLHIDTTPSATKELVANLNGSITADTMSKMRYQYITLWRPLRGPVKRWPMALCDNTTVNAERDLAAKDMVYWDRVVETFQVYFSESYKFYYLSDQMPNEAWVMLQSDSQGLTGVPHSSFVNPEVLDKDPQRESIEVRMFVYY